MPAKINLSEETISTMCELFCDGVSISKLMKFFKLGRNKITITLRENLSEKQYRNACAEVQKQCSIKAGKTNTGRKNPHTPEWNAKIANSNKGQKRSEKAKENISKALKKSYELGRRGKHSKHSKHSRHSRHWTPEKHSAAMKKAVETKRNNGYYKVHSKVHSEWMNKNAPMRGKSHSDKTKQKMKNARKKFFVNGGKTWMSGKTHSEKTRKKLSEHTKHMWKTGKFGYGSNGIFRSKLEKTVFNIIKKQYSCAKHSVPINTEKRTYVFDILVPELNLIIEINGDYWHMNPLIYDSNHIDKSRNIKASEIWLRDEQKLYAAKNAGYNVSVLWENDLNKNLKETINTNTNLNL